MIFPADPCRNPKCGHPYAEHDATDGEHGPCWHYAPDAPPPDGTPVCACDAFIE